MEAALQFVDDLLSEEIHNLRFWGVEGEDYQVGDDGLFYRTKEQRAKAAETDYKASHACSYSYFPQYDGTCDDGLNATKPSGQPKEFFDGLNEDVKKAFQAMVLKHTLRCLEQTRHLVHGIRCGHSQTTLQQTQRVEWHGPRLAKLSMSSFRRL